MGDQPATRHRLDVLAVTVEDVVAQAGGWLADRALAGWDVEVLVAQPDLDAAALRSLKIVGATASALQPELTSARRPRADAVAVCADLFVGDARVRDRVLRAYDRDLVEVTVWGDVIPTELAARFASVEHVLSGAAQAFKAHACGRAVAGTEMFRSGARRGLAGDLRPAASGG